MARLPLLSDVDLGLADDPHLNANYGVFRTLSHSPGAAAAFWGPVRYALHGSGLDPLVRETAILTVAFVTRTEYAWSHHIRVSRNAGIPDTDITALVDHLQSRPTTLGEKSKAVADAAIEMTETARLSDAAFARLEAQFDAASLADVIFVIANYNAVMRVLNGLQVDTEPDFLGYLDEFPVPSEG